MDKPTSHKDVIKNLEPAEKVVDIGFIGRPVQANVKPVFLQMLDALKEVYEDYAMMRTADDSTQGQNNKSN